MRLSPITDSIASSRFSSYPQFLSDLATNRGGFHDLLPLIFNYFLEQNLGNHLLIFSSLLLKDIIKDTNEQPNEKMDRVSSMEGSEHRTFYLYGVGMYHLFARG